jgi:hypothetical protein
MSADSTVVIAPTDLMAPLLQRLRATPGEFIPCTDADVASTIDIVIELRPARIAFERLFAATSRGAALLARLKADPALADAEFRIVSHDSDYWRVSPRRATGDGGSAPVAAPVAPAPPLDHRGTRRAPRVTIADTVEILVDGAQARLLDLSTLGAQVLSSVPLKPNQRVRVSMVDERVTLRCQAAVMWARFELIPGGGGPRYRVGLEFSGAEVDAIAEYGSRHQKRPT